jgi:hypothetical protein
MYHAFGGTTGVVFLPEQWIVNYMEMNTTRNLLWQLSLV